MQVDPWHTAVPPSTAGTGSADVAGRAVDGGRGAVWATGVGLPVTAGTTDGGGDGQVRGAVVPPPSGAPSGEEERPAADGGSPVVAPTQATGEARPVDAGGGRKRRTGEVPSARPTGESPVSEQSAAPVARAVATRGTATRSGGFWSLGVGREALGAAPFVCLDPSPRPERLQGVQPTCSILAGPAVAQCSRSDAAREVGIGDSVAWRLPCP